MAHNPHVIWAYPESGLFFRARGEIRPRPGSVLPKLSERGIRINVLIPYDSTLLPKTKLSAARVTRHTIGLSQNYHVEITKLTRGFVSPGVYMVKMPALEPALRSAVFSKSAIALAKQIKMPVDIFHVFNWESSLLPLFLEMDKNGSSLFKETRTFLNVQSLENQGNFSPAILSYLGIPQELFHPEGIEFFGKVSFLKSGLLFSDGVGVVEGSSSYRNGKYRNGNGLEGVLDTLMHKLRRWASERSLRSHVEVYEELLFMPKGEPLLPMLLHKFKTVQHHDVKSFIESWGPLPPERYKKNYIGFLLQSPHKAYAFWEWAGPPQKEFGLILEDHSCGSRTLLSRGLFEMSDYWIEVHPDRDYVVELVGWDERGIMKTLLRSNMLRTPRNAPSANQDVVFIDVRKRCRVPFSGMALWEELMKGRMGGGSGAWEWLSSGIPSSWRQGVRE